jgi:hypothetical protein
MLMKRGAAESQKEFSDYLLGSDFGKILSEASYPVLNGEVYPGKFSLSPLKWVGWDFIRSNNVFELRENLAEVFHRYYEA